MIHLKNVKNPFLKMVKFIWENILSCKFGSLSLLIFLAIRIFLQFIQVHTALFNFNTGSLHLLPLIKLLSSLLSTWMFSVTLNYVYNIIPQVPDILIQRMIIKEVNVQFFFLQYPQYFLNNRRNFLYLFSE